MHLLVGQRFKLFTKLINRCPFPPNHNTRFGRADFNQNLPGSRQPFYLNPGDRGPVVCIAHQFTYSQIFAKQTAVFTSFSIPAGPMLFNDSESETYWMNFATQIFSP
jgi:hypothetical protein